MTRSCIAVTVPTRRSGGSDEPTRFYDLGRVPALDTRLRQNVVPEPALGWLVAVDAEDHDQRGAEEYQPQGREHAADGGQKDLQRGARGVGTNLQAALDTHLRGVRGD